MWVTFYARLRYSDPHPISVFDFDDNDEEYAIGTNAVVAMINCFLLLILMIKLFDYLSIFPYFGQLLNLLRKTVSDMQAFTIFFFMWVVVFALIYEILAVSFDN